MKNPYIGISISVISVSFAAIIVLFCDTSPLTISFYRLLFTTLLILPIIIFHKKTRIQILNISLSNLCIMTIIGIILASHFALWITSLTKTSVASSVILVTSHPILVGPISYVFLKEKISKLNAFGVTFSVIGVITLVLGNYGLSNFRLDTLEGNILAFLGGIAAGLYILGGRKIRKNVSIFPYAFIVYSVATITLFILCLIFNAPIINISINDYQLIFLMALIAGILGHTLYNWSLYYIKASVASVFLLIEPIGSSILAYIIPSINQKPSIYTLIGGFIILSGIYLATQKTKNILNL